MRRLAWLVPVLFMGAQSQCGLGSEPCSVEKDPLTGVATITCPDGSSTVVEPSLLNSPDAGAGCTVTRNAETRAVTVTCADGTSATVSDGAPGTPGDAGEAGPAGAQGPAGANGSSCTVVRDADAGTTTLKCDNGTEATVTDGRSALLPVAISATPSSPKVGEAVTLTAVSPEAQAQFTWELKGAPQGSTAALSAGTGSTSTFTPDVAGRYFVVLGGSTATAAGTASLALSVEQQDTVAPETQLLNVPGALIRSAAASFSFSASEPGATFRCKVDALPAVSCFSPFAVSQLADGAHTFSVAAVDAAGNEDASPATVGFTVDTVAPETALSGGPAAATADTTATFSFTGTGGAVGFTCFLDGTSVTPCTSPLNLNGLADGPHSFSVEAVDAAGNADTTAAQHAWTVDTVAPAVTVSSAPPGTVGVTLAEFRFSASEPAGFTCSLDGAPFTACTSPWSLAVSADGPHTFSVVAKDAAGNVTATPVSHAWKVDTTAPDTALATPLPASPTGARTASIVFEANEVGATFRCAVDGAAPSVCTSPATLSGLVDGVHTFRVFAVDALGNTDATPAVHTWVVDGAPPETLLLSGPLDPTFVTSATFAFRSDEPGTTFACALDGAAPVPCTSPKAFTGLSVGAHTFTVAATDAVGNVDASPATFSWSVHSAPGLDTAITGGPALASNTSSATFSFVGQAAASFRCSLDGVPATPCSSPVNFTGLAEGTHSLVVAAVDAGGNADASPSNYDWSVDTSPPVTKLEQEPVNISSNTSPVVTFSASEPAAYFNCKLDNQTWQRCSPPLALGPLPDGNHSLRVYAVDLSGNADMVGTSTGWVVDTVPPDTSFTSAPPALSNDQRPLLSFTSSEFGPDFECSLDGATFEACIGWFVPHDDLAHGPHTLAVRAIDSAGNVDPTPAVHAWMVDAVAPDTALEAPLPPTVTRDASVAFSFSSTDSSAVFVCRFYEVSMFPSGWSPCSSPASYSLSGNYTFRFEVAAVDAAGNQDPTPAVRSVSIDTWEPVTTLTATPPSRSNEASPSFQFSCNEPDCTFVCSLDGADPTPCSSPAVLTVSEGPHTFAVVATDAAGNVQFFPAFHSWTVDLTPPAVPSGFALTNHVRRWSATWTQAQDVDFYTLHFTTGSPTDPFDQVILFPSRDNPMQDQERSCQTVHAVLVAHDLAGNASAPTPVASVTVRPTWQALGGTVSAGGANGAIVATATCNGAQGVFCNELQAKLLYADSPGGPYSATTESHGASPATQTFTNHSRPWEFLYRSDFLLTGFSSPGLKYLRAALVDAECEGELSDEVAASPRPWELISPLPSPNALRSIQCPSGGTGCTAVGDLGTSVSSTDGITWKQGDAAGQAGPLSSVSMWDPSSGFSATRSDSGDWLLLTTRDSGMSWSVAGRKPLPPEWTGSGGPGLPLTVTALSSSEVFLAGEHGAAFKVSLSGSSSTWVAQDTGSVGHFHGSAVVNVGPAPTIVLVGAGGTIRTTSTGGQTWQPRNSGVSTDLLAVSCVASGACWAVGAGGNILRSDDQGQSWALQNSVTSQALRAVSFASNSVGWAVGEAGSLVVTTNGGTDWVAQSSGETGTLNSVWAASPTHAWFAGDHGILRRTTDGGASWQDLRTVLVPENLTAVHARNASSFIASATGGKLYASSNGGQSVTQTLTGAGTVRAFWFTSPTEGFGVGEDGAILRTTDYGLNWTPQASGAVGLLRDIHCVSGSDCWVAGGDHLLHTMNAGALWSPVPTAIAYAPRTTAIRFETESVGYLGTVSVKPAGQQNIFKTTDRGTTWNFVGYAGYHTFFSGWDADGEMVSALELTPGDATGDRVVTSSCFGYWNGECTDARQLVCSEPGGFNFTARTSGAIRDMASRGNRVVAVGRNGSVSTSTTGGQSWANSTTGTDIHLTGVAMATDDVIYVVGEGGIILKSSTFGR